MPEGTDQRSATLLRAHLKDIEIVGDLEKKSPSRKPDHFVVVSVDGKAVLTSKKKPRVPTPWWADGCQFWFQPSSIIKVEIFRRSMLWRFPLKNYLVGRYTGKIAQLLENNTALDLMDENGGAIVLRIKMKLSPSLISESPEVFMRGVDADVARLNGNTVLANASDHVDTAVAMIQPSSVVVQTLGNCVGPLGQALQLIVKIMDSFADVHPILKVSWTILSSVYKAVRGQMLQDDHVRSLAESLREMVGIAAECPDLQFIHGTTNIIEEIGCLSLQIALLIDECVRLSFIRRTMKSQLSDDMKSCIEQCKTCCSDLMGKFDRRLGMNTNKKVARIAEHVDRTYLSINTIKDAQLAKDVYQWLSPPDPSRNYNEAREKHQAETCSWFIDGTRFVDWKAQADIFLWIYGLPGSGKTILCSSIIKNVIEHCRLNASFACAYFFFDGRDSQTALQLHGNLLRSLILQFSDQCDGLPASLVKLHIECNKGHQQPSIEALGSTLQYILGTFNHAYIIIDSLDECIDRSKLLKWIRKMASWKVGRLHLLVASRPEQDIENHLKLLDLGSLCIADESANHDIMAYINQMFQTDGQLSKWDQNTQDSIKVALIKGAQGMFRWVALQLDELQNCPTLLAVEEQLTSLPKDLDGTYDKILMNIKKNYQNDTKTFLQWCAFSAQPLKLEELATVTGMELCLEKGSIYNLKRQYKNKEAVLLACSSLVTHSKGVVKLAHFSVKEYLISEHIKKGIASSFSINKRASHLLIAQTCLAYLLQFDTLNSINSTNIQSFPLALYAGAHWIFHVQSGNNETLPTIQKLILNLFKPFDPPFTNWIRLWDPDCNPWDDHTDFNKPRTDVVMPIYYASMTGLQKTAQQLLKNGEDVNVKGGNYGHALQAASAGGHEAIVKLLLENSADVNAEGGDYGNALQAASAEDHEAIVKLLLENGADVNVNSGGHYGNALQAASVKGHKAIVKLLLKNGADVNIEGGLYGNALQAASAEDHGAIVKLLLENGADVNANSREYYGNALQAASAGGHEVIINLLLKNAADVNAKRGGHYGHALQAASAEGHEAIVNLLLENGAGISAEGGYYGNALQAGSAGGHEAIVNLLLENGADVNADGGYYGNALQAASARGHQAIIKLLFVKGADVNTKGGGHYGNALQAASAEGHEAIVKLLLENGTNVNADRGYYGNALQAASAGGNEVIVNLLLENDADVNANGGYYGNALQAASAGGHQVIVKLLLENGANVSAKEGGCYGNALQAASAGGHEVIVTLLLKNSANVNVDGGRYGNALQAALDGGNQAIVKLLLENGADVNAEVRHYGNALQAASARGNEAIVKLLLENSADVNAKGGGHYGNALQAAAVRGHEAIVKLLLENGADVNAKGEGHYGNALQAASAGGNKAIVKLLLENDANVNANGGYYDNALQAASVLGYKTIVRLLLENGADVNAKGGHYDNALQAASAGGHEVIVNQLLENGADVNAKGGRHYGNALQAASAGGNEAIVKLLLEKGADVNAKIEHYGNALQTASDGGHEAIVKLLLENGADINAKGGHYGNALGVASARGHGAIVKLLLENGAVVNAEGGYYGNALQAASDGGHQAIVNLLLKNGAHVNAKLGGYYGNALQAASVKGHGAVVKLLLENGADVSAEGGLYGNVLLAASAEDHEAIVMLLLENGADVNANSGGYYGNALRAASVKGHEAIVKLLLEKGADVNADGGYYGNALQAASAGGHQAIANLLLENGAVEQGLSNHQVDSKI